MIIRSATIDDAQALLDIYAPYVQQTAITFEYEVPSLDEFRRRMTVFSSCYPYLVAEDNGQIVGYCYACAFHERAAYQWSVETCIYVKQDERHKGIGYLLHEALEKALRQQGILNMNACIAYTDHEDEYLTLDSVHFHERLGYTLAAHFHRCGKKFDRWYDMVWMEKLL